MKKTEGLPDRKRRISERQGLTAANGAARLAAERERLLRGEKPQSILPNRQQHMAARLLAGFFVMMLALTFLSRMAASLTIAEVSTGSARAGVLTRRYIIPGTVETRDTLDIVLPCSLRVSGVMVSEGDSVDTGDVLLKLDMASLQDAIEQMENEIMLLDMRIANLSLGTPGVETGPVRRAETSLQYARQDYQRLLAVLEDPDEPDLSGERAEEDLREARTRYDESLLTLERAKVTAREQLITEAQRALSDAEYSRSEAVAAAQAAADSADAAEHTAEAAYQNAADTLDRAREQRKQAYRALRDLGNLDPPAPAEEIAAAETQAAAAEDQVYRAEADVNVAKASLSAGGITHARENLRRVRERHDHLVDEAEAALMAARNETDFDDVPLVAAAQAAADSAEADLKAAERRCEDAELSLAERRALAQQAVESARRDVELAETELASAQKQAENAYRSDEILRSGNETEKLQYTSEREQKQDILAQMKELFARDGMITAPEAGTVRMIASRGTVPADSAAVVLSRSGQNFQFSAQTEQKTAEQLSEGDTGTLSFTCGGTRRTENVRITSIGVPNAEGQARITVSLDEGSFIDGMAGELELEKNSGRYQTILPISALRVMDGRTVVLVVRENQSVMGTEQTAEEVDVTVKEQDTENMAVEAALFPDDRVVVHSSKPIRKGDRVRAEN